jgi:hypothetical protein
MRPEELSHLESERWSAVARVLNQPWFYRVWTLQEIGLANDAVMLFGEAEFPFDLILKVLCFLDTHGLLFKPFFNIKLDPRYSFVSSFTKVSMQTYSEDMPEIDFRWPISLPF